MQIILIKNRLSYTLMRKGNEVVSSLLFQSKALRRFSGRGMDGMRLAAKAFPSSHCSLSKLRQNTLNFLSALLAKNLLQQFSPQLSLEVGGWCVRMERRFLLSREGVVQQGLCRFISASYGLVFTCRCGISLMLWACWETKVSYTKHRTVFFQDSRSQTL